MIYEHSTFYGSTVRPGLKIFISRSNFKIKVARSQIMVSHERSCCKAHVKYEGPTSSS